MAAAAAAQAGAGQAIGGKEGASAAADTRAQAGQARTEKAAASALFSGLAWELRDPPFTFHTKQRTQMEGNGPITGNNGYGDVKSHF